MLRAFLLQAKPGKRSDLERVLSDEAVARRVAKAMGATRNSLFAHGDRFVRVLEFPDGATPVPIAEVAAQDPEVREVLRRIGELTDPPFDPADPGTLDAFSRAIGTRQVLDVRA